MKFADRHYAEFKTNGYMILHNALSEEQRSVIAQGLCSCLEPWDAIKDNPPETRSKMQGFPFSTLALNRFFVEPGLVAFVKRRLGSDAIQYRPGYAFVRYSGENIGTNQGWHIDNGNNSLLLESRDWRYGQVVVWYFPEAVEAAQGALCLVPKPHEMDIDHIVVLAVPANTVAVFHNFVWHSGSEFTADYGQRYSHAGMYGLSKIYWDGFVIFPCPEKIRISRNSFQV